MGTHMISKKDKAVLQKFGEHIKELREGKNLTLRELSAACEIDNSKISRIEMGKMNITLLTLLELASGLELPPSDLMDF